MYIHNKYNTVHIHVLCKQKVLFWMRLIAINNLTALNFRKRSFSDTFVFCLSQARLALAYCSFCWFWLLPLSSFVTKSLSIKASAKWLNVNVSQVSLPDVSSLCSDRMCVCCCPAVSSWSTPVCCSSLCCCHWGWMASSSGATGQCLRPSGSGNSWSSLGLPWAPGFGRTTHSTGQTQLLPAYD